MKNEKNKLSLQQFQEKFGTDEKCRDYLYKTRWPDGPTCKHCGGKKFYRITDRDVYECAQCGHQVSLTAGTVMERHHVSLVTWFTALYLVAVDKRGISAMQLQKELDVRYTTAWTMLHKIRKAMGDRDADYKLAGIVELDDTYFGGPSEGEGKCGRGTDKTPVEVGVSVDKQGRPLYVKMEVIPDIKHETLVTFAERNIEEGSQLNTDAYSAYIKAFEDNKYDHRPLKFDPIKNPDHLAWLHTIISNAKTFVLGTYHGLNKEHLQAYLDEFCYRINRRTYQSKLFMRLVVAIASSCVITYDQIVHPVPIG
jgi:transposase-like protein